MPCFNLTTTEMRSKVKTFYCDPVERLHSFAITIFYRPNPFLNSTRHGHTIMSLRFPIQNLGTRVNQEPRVSRPIDYHFRPFDFHADTLIW
jgi:hypothetical protein